MWYLLVIDRLKHMFSNPRDAELLLWHVNRKTDGKIRHPVEGSGNNLILLIRRTSLMIQEISGLDLEQME
jgi:hypothetical protein